MRITQDMYDKLGFTLIELSIVLIIIALIVAGIMGGRETGSTSTPWKPGWISSMAYCDNVIPIACVVPD